MEPALHLAPDWEAALAAAQACRQTLVLGPPDVGKSSFIRALAGREPALALLDLDPGQKMLGPPGSASLGSLAPAPSLERFVFLGSTAVGSFRALADAADRLLAAAGARPVAVNTSGYVFGPGASLQLMTLAALRPELVVAIGLAGPLAAALPAAPAIIRLEPSPLARRKPAGLRRRVRQAAFAAALAGADERRVDRSEILFEPGPPAPIAGDARPVCALADRTGTDMALRLLRRIDADAVALLAPPTPRPVARLRLGRMWARDAEGGPILLDRLAPSWQAEEG